MCSRGSPKYAHGLLAPAAAAAAAAARNAAWARALQNSQSVHSNAVQKKGISRKFHHVFNIRLTFTPKRDTISVRPLDLKILDPTRHKHIKQSQKWITSNAKEMAAVSESSRFPDRLLCKTTLAHLSQVSK